MEGAKRTMVLRSDSQAALQVPICSRQQRPMHEVEWLGNAEPSGQSKDFAAHWQGATACATVVYRLHLPAVAGVILDGPFVQGWTCAHSSAIITILNCLLCLGAHPCFLVNRPGATRVEVFAGDLKPPEDTCVQAREAGYDHGIAGDAGSCRLDTDTMRCCRKNCGLCS
jgi:hypothetical protein